MLHQSHRRLCKKKEHPQYHGGPHRKKEQHHQPHGKLQSKREHHHQYHRRTSTQKEHRQSHRRTSTQKERPQSHRRTSTQTQHRSHKTVLQPLTARLQQHTRARARLQRRDTRYRTRLEHLRLDHKFSCFTLHNRLTGRPPRPKRKTAMKFPKTQSSPSLLPQRVGVRESRQ